MNVLQREIINDDYPELIIPNENENIILNELDDSYKKISEMTEDERQFINSLILRVKPVKLLELGVSRGSSSIVMLNAIKNIDNAKLYSIDRFDKFYGDHSINNGSAVDEYPHLKNKWKLYTGGLALDFIDEIGGSIDFCLIDTMHMNPGEILDFLMVLPYLKDDATVVFHDTNLHTHMTLRAQTQFSITNNLLMSAIKGKKYIQGNFVSGNTEFPNVAAVKINDETKKHIWEIFNLLTINWMYLPEESDLIKTILHFNRFYNWNYIEYFKKIITFQRKRRT